MTARDLKVIRDHHEKLEMLEHFGRFKDADAYFEANRWAFDYDDKGNWVGSVPNENGWTA